MEQVNRNKLAERIIGAAIKVHKQFGPGLVVNFYVKALCLELAESKISFESPSFLPVLYNEQSIGMCEIDMLVGNSIVLKFKNLDEQPHGDQYYEKCLLSSMRLGKYKLGLLFDFNSRLLKDGIKRYSL